jgi:hypothetical protein
MSRRGQRRGYDENNGYEARDRSGAVAAGGGSQRRMNGDYASSMSSTSMTRELDDLVRTIESEWGNVTSITVSNPQSKLHDFDVLMMASIPPWRPRCSFSIEVPWAGITTLSKHYTSDLNVLCNS